MAVGFSPAIGCGTRASMEVAKKEQSQGYDLAKDIGGSISGGWWLECVDRPGLRLGSQKNEDLGFGVHKEVVAKRAERHWN